MLSPKVGVGRTDATVHSLPFFDVLVFVIVLRAHR